MPTLLLYGVYLFTLALVFYSISVWANWFSKQLKLWHIYIFLVGLFLDYLATILTYISLGGLVFTLHAIVGFISIFLMTIHVSWAIYIYVKKEEKAKLNFHKISLIIWSFWVLSYLSGAISGMVKLV